MTETAADPRKERRHKFGKRDQRGTFQRDRDRVLYCSAFRRLAGVTQVVIPGEGQVFHNRLTHSIKVAQLARRLAEYLNGDAERSQILQDSGVEVHPEVCAAAGLAHDIGHPAFAHAAEQALDELVFDSGEPEGFAGNPQTFRLLSTLAVHRDDYVGLNLCRAVLAAVVKYPSLGRSGVEPNREDRKFGAYLSEKDDFDFAGIAREPSLEAQVMNHADDIAYAVHDFEDFTRNGLISTDRLLDPLEFQQLLKAWKLDEPEVYVKKVEPYESPVEALVGQVKQLSYDGSPTARSRLREFTSVHIGNYVKNVELASEAGRLRLEIAPELQAQILFLKRLVWVYVIHQQRLASQQCGVRRIVQTLFDHYRDAATPKNAHLLPARFRPMVERQIDSTARIAADVIASLTDAEALAIYRRVSGVDLGSIHDLIQA